MRVHRMFLFALLVAGASLAGLASGADASPVSVSFFHERLAPHGRWIVAASLGDVWVPSGIAAGWAPYTDGEWTLTDYGWTWVSYDPWGDVPCHYGAWTWVDPYGWVWAPGTVWAPAWVTWAYTDDFVGWAPLPAVLRVLGDRLRGRPGRDRALALRLRSHAAVRGCERLPRARPGRAGDGDLRAHRKGHPLPGVGRSGPDGRTFAGADREGGRSAHRARSGRGDQDEAHDARRGRIHEGLPSFGRRPGSRTQPRRRQERSVGERAARGRLPVHLESHVIEARREPLRGEAGRQGGRPPHRGGGGATSRIDSDLPTRERSEGPAGKGAQPEAARREAPGLEAALGGKSRAEPRVEHPQPHAAAPVHEAPKAPPKKPKPPQSEPKPPPMPD